MSRNLDARLRRLEARGAPAPDWMATPRLTAATVEGLLRAAGREDLVPIYRRAVGPALDRFDPWTDDKRRLTFGVLLAPTAELQYAIADAALDVLTAA